MSAAETRLAISVEILTCRFDSDESPAETESDLTRINTKIKRERISSDKLATARGIALNSDDQLRAAVIEKIMCTGQVDWVEITARFHIEPATYYANEQGALAPFKDANTISHREKKWGVTPQRRLLMRAVAMVFDTYKNSKRAQNITFSRIA